MTVSELNGLAHVDAAAEFRRCCGSARWAERMARARPFRDFDSLAVTGDVVWNALHPDDWREAFAAHPRIGEGGVGRAGKAGGPEAAWPAQEQAAAANADAEVKRRLHERNRDYEARFGYIFIVCATGKSASEMLTILERRLSNDPDRELRIAADEQRQIARLRLAKLLDV